MKDKKTKLVYNKRNNVSKKNKNKIYDININYKSYNKWIFSKIDKSNNWIFSKPININTKLKINEVNQSTNYSKILRNKLIKKLN